MIVFQKRADFGSRPMNGFLDDLWNEFEEVIKDEVVEAVVPPPPVVPSTPAPTVVAKPAPTPVPTYTYPSVGSGLVSIQPYPSLPSVGAGIIPDLTLSVQPQPSVGSGIIQQGLPMLQPTYAAQPATGFDFNKALIYGGAGLAAVLVLALALRR